MKRILFLGMTFCFAFNLFAQKAPQSVEAIKYEGVITQIITLERFNTLQVEVPSKLLDIYYNTYHFCYISDQLPEGAEVKGDYCHFICEGQTCDDAQSLISSQQINHRKYAFPQGENQVYAYTLGSSGYYIIVNSVEEYKRNYAAFMKQYGF